MSRAANVDLEKATKKAWRAFRNELADRLSGLAPHQSISVGVESAVVDDPSSGTAPYVQFARGNGDLVRAEVSGNQYLHSAHRLSKVGRRSLAALGWSRPMPKLGRFNFEFDADTSHADQLAALTVVTLREVFAVPHPAFLTGDVAIAEDRDLPQVEPNETRDEALAVMPESRLHLEQLVDLALATSLGHAPNRDEDGDIPIVSGTAVVFVRVLPDRPGVELAVGNESIGSESIAAYVSANHPCPTGTTGPGGGNCTPNPDPTPDPPVTGDLALAGKLTVKGRQLTVKLTCKIGNDTCRRANLVIKGAPKKGKKGKNLLVVKKRGLAANPGQTKTFRIKLTNKARKFFRDRTFRKRGKKKTIRGPRSLRSKITINGKNAGFRAVKRVGKVR